MGRMTTVLSKAHKLREGRPVSLAGEETDPRLVAILDPHGPHAEQYRTLRTNLRGLDAEAPPRSLVVTSATPQEGKSVTALNLAATLADAEDVRVVVVDADLRKPTLHRLLGVDNQRGLSDYLAGSLMVELVLERTRVSNLTLLPAGRVPGNPTELLAGKRMLDLVTRLSRDHDYVIVDTPPVVAMTDAAVVAPMVDGVLLVVRMGQAPQDVVLTAVDLLAKARARVLGTIATGVAITHRDYYYYPGE